MVIKRTDLTTEEQIDKVLIEISKANPTKFVTVYGSLGTVRFYISDTMPTTDSLSTVQTFEQYGGFFKNGQIVKPAKRWLARYYFIPVEN